MIVDRKFNLARKWSNRELKKFSHLFSGNIVNVSGWTDDDKEGGKYSDYFINKGEYYLTNYQGERGYQKKPNEIFLDLSKKIPDEIVARFDVVFNHTTLEHIFDVQIAFQNLCSLSNDIVILVVPFSQEHHETDSYKDYWRFTPTCIQFLFQENEYETLYISWNNDKNSATYIFAIGSQQPIKWHRFFEGNLFLPPAGDTIGKRRDFVRIFQMIENKIEKMLKTP